jgi:hypothetical protein
MIATSGPLQWATLGVVIIAAIVSAAGGIYNARKTAQVQEETTELAAELSTKSEHRIWQREVRVRAYSELTGAIAEQINASQFMAGRSREERHHSELTISALVANVRTFGSKSVSDAASVLFEIVLADGKREASDGSTIWEALETFLHVVRESLGIENE